MTIPIIDYSAGGDSGPGRLIELRNKLNQLRLFPGQLENQRLSNQLLGQQNTGAQISNQTAQGALEGAYRSRLDSVIAQATAGMTDPAQIQAAGADAIARGAAAGLYPPDFGAKALGGGSGGIDWKAIARQAVLGAGNKTELDATIGTPGSVNQGGTITATVTKAGPEGVTVDKAGGTAAALPVTLTPSEKVAGIATVDPITHAPTRTPVGAAFTDTGEPRTAAPIVTGNAPGVAESQTVAYAEQVKRAQAIADRAAEVPTRRAALENLRGLASEFASGPNAGFWTKVGQFAQEYGLPAPHATSDATAANEEFNKLAVGVMALQRQQMGLPSTDASTALTTGAVPSDHLSAKGIQRVTGLMEGNEDYIAAMNQARLKWQGAHHNNGETTNDFQAQFNRIFDPRVFQAQYMTADQRARVREQVGAAKFDAQQNAARRLGWLRQQDAEPAPAAGNLAGATAAGLVR